MPWKQPGALHGKRLSVSSSSSNEAPWHWQSPQRQQRALPPGAQQAQQQAAQLMRQPLQAAMSTSCSPCRSRSRVARALAAEGLWAAAVVAATSAAVGGGAGAEVGAGAGASATVAMKLAAAQRRMGGKLRSAHPESGSGLLARIARMQLSLQERQQRWR